MQRTLGCSSGREHRRFLQEHQSKHDNSLSKSEQGCSHLEIFEQRRLPKVAFKVLHIASRLLG